MKSYESFEVNLLGKDCFDRFKDYIRNIVYEVTYVLLKYHSTSTHIESLLLIFQYLQMLSYTFHNEFIQAWKSVETLTQISNFLAYFQIIEFFRNDPTIWITMFYVSIMVIACVVAKWGVVYKYSSQLETKYTFVISLLKNSMWILSTILFIPITQILISSFSCELETSKEIYLVKFSLVECYTTSHLAMMIISGVFISIFLFLSFSFQMLFYEIQPYSNQPDSRYNSKSNVLLLFAKLVNVILFSFSQSFYKAFIVIVMLAISLYQFFAFLANYPYYKNFMNKLTLYLNLIYLWSLICLGLCLILETSKFNGGIALFVCGIIPFSLIIYFQTRNRVMYLLSTTDKFKKGENIMQQISCFLDLVDNKIERSSEINLVGYIKLHEETCTLKDCPLRHYCDSLEQSKIEIIAYLLQHAEILYRNGISKFPRCVPLRLSFVFFLIERLNKKYQANVELSNTEAQCPDYEERFVIYRYKKILQANNTNNSDDTEMTSNIAYRTYLYNFKSNILKATSLYIEFWGHLMLKNQENEDDLLKLNSYGEMINSLIEDIDKSFDKLQRLRSLDQEIIRWYSEFLAEVLNSPNKAHELKNKISMVLGRQTYEDVNLLNIDMNALTSNDDSQYIVISAREHNIGNIINISVGICSMFGYSRNELIGRSVDAVMPDIYHKGHRQVLFNRLNDYKKKSVNNINNKKEKYKPTFRENSTFARNKLRYLIPISFKVTLLPNENKDPVFIAKIWQDLYNHSNSKSKQICFILTNNQLIIQNFTVNAVKILGLTSNLINGTCEITQFIQQLSDEILKYTDVMSDTTIQKRNLLKQKIIKTKFSKRTMIDWRFTRSETHIGFSLIKNALYNETLLQNEGKLPGDVKFYLTVTDVVLYGNKEGYIFKIEKVFSENKEDEDLKNSFSLDKTITDRTTSKIDLDKNFVPNSDANFNIDIQSMSYNIYHNNRINNDLKKEIKQKAIESLKQPEETNEIKEVESEETESFPDESELTYSDMTDQESFKENIVENSDLNEYYKVKLANIKFLIWNPYQNQIIEVQNWSKQSNVELKKGMNNEADFYEPALTSSYKSNYKKLTNTPENSNIQEEETNEKELMAKQLEYSLKKEEKQSTITKLKWVSFSSCSFIFGLGLTFLICMLVTFDTIKENVTLIYNSHEMIHSSVDGTYYMQELLLLKNKKYTNTYRPKEEHLNNTLTEMMKLYNTSHNYQIYVIKSFLPLSEAASNFTTKYTFDVNIITDSSNVENYKLTVSSAFLGVSSALFKIVKDPIEKIMPTNKNAYYYLYNSLNGLMNGLYLQADTYMAEIDLNIKTGLMTLLYLVITACLGLIVCYFLLIWTFVAVSRRKESYLQVFFEIPQSVIKRCLEKCEIFTKQLQSDMLNDELSISIDKEDEPTAQPIKLMQIKQTKKKNLKKTSGSARIRLFLIVGLLFFALYFVMCFIFYQFYLYNLKNQLLAYKQSILSRIEYKKLFVILRAYMFDENSFANSMDVGDYFEDVLQNIYKVSQNEKNDSAANMVYYSGEFKKMHSKIINNDLCNVTNLDDCDIFISKSTEYGLDVTVSNYIEEIRELKHDYIMQKTNRNSSFVYNNTLYGSPLANSLYPSEDLLTEYEQQDPFLIFNTDSHKNVELIYELLLIPMFNFLNNLQIDYINHENENLLTTYVIIFSLFLSLLVICFLFIWKPFEMKLNGTIYKSKNMLSIIPKEILSSLESINKLLDIGKGRKKTQQNGD